ncbi:MAG: hypothetical protein WC140_05815 [Bacteroidales bacterium]
MKIVKKIMMLTTLTVVLVSCGQTYSFDQAIKEISGIKAEANTEITEYQANTRAKLEPKKAKLEKMMIGATEKDQATYQKQIKLIDRLYTAKLQSSKEYWQKKYNNVLEKVTSTVREFTPAEGITIDSLKNGVISFDGAMNDVIEMNLYLPNVADTLHKSIGLQYIDSEGNVIAETEVVLQTLEENPEQDYQVLMEISDKLANYSKMAIIVK